MTTKTLKDFLLKGSIVGLRLKHESTADYAGTFDKTKITYVVKDLDDFEGRAVLVVEEGDTKQPQMLPLSEHYKDQVIE